MHRSARAMMSSKPTEITSLGTTVGPAFGLFSPGPFSLGIWEGVMLWASGAREVVGEGCGDVG